MHRRAFFGALGTALAVPAAPRRVYSFLWDNPLVVAPHATSFFDVHEFYNDHSARKLRVVIRGLANPALDDGVYEFDWTSEPSDPIEDIQKAARILLGR